MLTQVHKHRYTTGTGMPINTRAPEDLDQLHDVRVHHLLQHARLAERHLADLAGRRAFGQGGVVGLDTRDPGVQTG